ncbi:MFS transporter [uncultured Methylobacterium sp.]|uniref:MFS transporter n=1 Tax=uncultured Methylobacterium sp. TaxID=157278 RepID=UPI0035CC9758
MLSRPLPSLAAASFAIGTTEFVIMGLLPEVAESFGVSVPQAGLLVSGYAMGVAVGAPIVAIATARLPRKTALLVLMAVFLVGNLACALAPSYALLMVARIVTAFAHGAFFGIGAVVATSLVPRHQRTQAVALMFTGLTLANVLGVPFGTALGQAIGWRSTFFAVFGTGVVAAAAIAASVPSGIPGSLGGLAGEFRSLRRWEVMRPMLVSILAAISLFTVFTYITPLLRTQSGLSPEDVTWALLVFGIGLTLGNLAGGKLADTRLAATIVGGFAGLVAVMVLFAFTSRAAWPAVLTLPLWGALVFALVSPLQIWVVEAASDAPNLASTLNQGAFNLGNAAGAALGGAALTLGFGYAALPWIGAAIAALALALTLSGRVGAGDGEADRFEPEGHAAPARPR